ncbi:hypothetical protein [Reyranella sp.]|jgi:hypothetical protein|uniref:hypothetical protein n=1 Tax=Reyranella sp. TaxID=1929291 RepID=UPI002F92C4BC
MIIEGEWERIDPAKPKAKLDSQAKPVKVEPVEADPPKGEEQYLAAAVEAYFEQSGTAQAARSAVAEEQSDAFKQKLAGLKEHLRERDPKG